jgi:hypothetical protein
VVLARRKLQHYFEAQPVTVISSFPLGEIIRKVIKSQILADFVVEWTDMQLPPPQI